MRKSQHKDATPATSAIPAHLLPLQASGSELSVTTLVSAKVELPDLNALRKRRASCAVSMEFVSGCEPRTRIRVENAWTADEHPARVEEQEFVLDVDLEALPLVARVLTEAVRRAFEHRTQARVDAKKQDWPLL